MPSSDLPTYASAKEANAYALARKWADQNDWPARLPREVAERAGLAVRELSHELDELATMAALRYWLDAWTPAQIHHALMAGATVDQVAAAIGTDRDDVTRRWHTWSDGQRRLERDLPNLTSHAAEYDHIAALLDQQNGDGPAPAGCTRPRGAT